MPCEDSGPATIVEWFAGTSAASMARRRRRRARRQAAEARSLFRFELTTDDEFGEDTMHVTYPRTGSSHRCPKPALEPEPGSEAAAEESEPASEPVSKVAAGEVTVKKVRFEQAEPKKSALKKTRQHTTTTTTTTKTTTDSPDADSESQSESIAEDLSVAESSEEPEPVTPARKLRKAKKAKLVEEDSASDSEVCDCEVCTKKRQKAKRACKGKKQPDFDELSDSEASSVPGTKQGKQKKKKVATPETSDSEAELPAESRKSGKKKKKVMKQVEEPDSVDETEAATGEETEEEPEYPPKSKEANVKRKGIEQQGKTEKNNKNSSGQGTKTTKDTEGDRLEANSSRRRDERMNNYPEANTPATNPRRPHYIEPIRAETGQTERVLEGPEDPRPNAYYDAQHNVLRVYHGPVWGSRGEQALYPDRDQSMRPPPVGVPHPLHNAYEHDIKSHPHDNRPPYGSSSGARYGPYAPVYGPPCPGWDSEHTTTHRPPPNFYNAWYPPPFYNPAMQGDPRSFGHGPFSTNKGAFAGMSGANGPGSSPSRTKSASNNVGPGSAKDNAGKDNPYYKAAKSKFTAWSDRQPSNASQKSNHSNKSNKVAEQWGEGAGNNSSNSNNNSTTGWGDNANTANDDWANNDNARQTAWSNNDDQPGTDVWGQKNAEDNNGGRNTTEDVAVGSAGNNDEQNSSGQGGNNVAPPGTMPGAWEPLVSSTGADWADTTAAATTGGRLDNEAMDNVQPSVGW